MIWTEAQLANMRSILAGWLERAERVNARRREIRASKGPVITMRRVYRFKEPCPVECLDRFFSMLSAPTGNGCREWTGAKNGTFGHGCCNIATRLYLTHRVAWIVANGSIPEDIEVCHSCDNPPCCEHTHLFLGTHAVNMADCKSKGRNRWMPRPGESNNRAKLTEDDIRAIRTLAKTATHKVIAVQFGITRPNVGFIVNRKTWNHVT